MASATNVPLLAAALDGPLALIAQEPRQSPGTAVAIGSSLRASQAQPLWPPGNSPLVAGFVRVAAARVFPLLTGLPLQARIARFTVFRPRAPLHLLAVYSPVGGGLAAAQSCTHLVRAMLEEAAAIGHEPCLILGDFNFDPLPPRAAAMLAMSGWADLAAGLGPTTRRQALAARAGA